MVTARVHGGTFAGLTMKVGKKKYLPNFRKCFVDFSGLRTKGQQGHESDPVGRLYWVG